MKPITTSVYTFRDLIEGGYLYVDKTALLHTLVAPFKGVYFLSRPRRFGKSLTLATLEEIFLGNRDLFRGLAIHDLPFDWRAHPVIRIDLGSRHASNTDELKTVLCIAVKENADRYGVKLETPYPHTQFQELVVALGKKDKVVILIDEYDKPILGNLENGNEVTKVRDVLKAFYSVVKSADRYLRFAFLTGVSKFSRVSVFSDLNNLQDLTMDARYATLCGYTQAELESNFAAYLERVAAQRGCDVRTVLEQMREWYNGYRFSEAQITVYNPVSVGRFLDSGKLSNYWFETGTPSFLIKLLKAGRFDLPSTPDQDIGENAFSTYDVERLDPLPLLVQTGYLTIRDVSARGERLTYRLGYPNREVEEAFGVWLTAAYSEVTRAEVDSALFAMADALRAGDLDACFARLCVFFAAIPNTISLKHEKYYQTIFYTIFTLIGYEVDVEVATNVGRIDAVVRTASTIFVFEFKLHGTAEDALAQIREKRYFEKYLADGRDVVLVGAAFDPETRNLERWLTARP